MWGYILGGLSPGMGVDQYVALKDDYVEKLYVTFILNQTNLQGCIS
jgi:hypothetical protein